MWRYQKLSLHLIGKHTVEDGITLSFYMQSVRGAKLMIASNGH